LRISVRLIGIAGSGAPEEVDVSLPANTVTLGEALREVCRIRPEFGGFLRLEPSDGALWDIFMPIVNGRTVDLLHRLNDGDVVTILPPMDGG